MMKNAQGIEKFFARESGLKTGSGFSSLPSGADGAPRLSFKIKEQL
jgi:hypothetical protein